MQKQNSPKQDQYVTNGFFDSILGSCIYIAIVAVVAVINKNKGYY